MSVESEETTGESGLGIGPCRNAEEYAIELLKSKDGTVSPAEAAEGHGCTPGHMQDVLRESEATERVEIGEYALSTEITTTGEDTGSRAGSGYLAGFMAPSSATDEDTETERPSVGGPAQSGDLDGTAGDQEDSEVPIDENGDGGEAVDDLDGDGPEPVPVGAVEEDDEMGGIPLPVSTTALYAGVALALLAMYWYSKRSGGESEQSQEQAESGDGEDYGGLIPDPNEVG